MVPMTVGAPPDTTRDAVDASTARTRPDPIRALVAPSTWLGATHLLLDALLGTAYTVVLGTGLVMSVALLPLALAGVPVWIVTAWVSRMMAGIERTRYRLLLDVRIDPPPMPPVDRNPLRYGGALWRDDGVRRRALHQAVAMPLGLLTAGLVWLTVSGGLALLGSVTIAVLFPPASSGGLVDRHVLGLPLSDTPTAQMLLGAAGLLLVLVAPMLVRGLVAVDVAVARTLLGPPPRVLARRVHELERSRARVVDAGETERRRIERDLHDGTQQQLVALGMTLGRAKARYADDPGSIGELLDDAHQQAKDAVTDLRLLIRGLHPPVLADRGLDAALSAIAVRCPVPVELSVEIERRPPATVEAIGYFVVAEALTNVARHSGASAAVVRVRREDDGPVWITVTDNGTGGADPGRGTGLRGLRDRVSAVDGQLSVDSPVGGPTVLTVELPCDVR
ncbi:sensor histidine kinase [Pseudonocardia lacus]|uniref:sensor histidine kinase n=1 Tax=Pseudonocardia lacus TaxID=2835865 RepID=UPI002028BA1F|nr:sensor histidine kinase [Pseudonocardia lacus]